MQKYQIYLKVSTDLIPGTSHEHDCNKTNKKLITVSFVKIH